MPCAAALQPSIRRLRCQLVISMATEMPSNSANCRAVSTMLRSLLLPKLYTPPGRAKLVAFSSDQVYSGAAQEGPLPETLSLSPSNIYGQHKLEAEQRVLEVLPDAVFLRVPWMYDLPGYQLPIRGNLPLNLLRAALKGETVRFSRNDFRGVTYVRQVIENLEPAMELPGGVYNFGSGNAEDMVCTARRFAKALGITVKITEESWERNLVMDAAKLERSGIRFAATQQGIRCCLRDYGLSDL